MKRWQTDLILKDLQKKMVLLAGPRQAGKTWLAQEIGKHFTRTTYLNYDRIKDRVIIHEESWLENTELLILDELHKMPGWKNYLKGTFDTKPAHMKILVTGSARLELMHQMGDSLVGRYFLHHLLPFSPAELTRLNQHFSLDHFLDRGGFPEPYLAEDPLDANRWRQQYINGLLSVDALEVSEIHDIANFKLVFELLRHRVGSPVSFKSIAEDIGISPNTVKKYIQILESLYVVFRVTPFSKNIARSLLKEPKIYFFDNGLVEGDIGSKLENFVATCLLKHVYAKIDYEAKPCSLHYLRTKDGIEVDFALTCNDKIERIIEVKHANDKVSQALSYFHEKYQLPATQIIKELKREKMQGRIEILKLEHFLKELTL